MKTKNASYINKLGWFQCLVSNSGALVVDPDDVHLPLCDIHKPDKRKPSAWLRTDHFPGTITISFVLRHGTVTTLQNKGGQFLYFFKTFQNCTTINHDLFPTNINNK